MPAVLFVLYLVVEFAALFGLSQLIGTFPAILVLIGVSAAGVLLIRSQGRRVFAQLGRAGRGEAVPGAAVANGVLVAAGAFLISIPGLVTSVVGLLFLLPPTRFVIRPFVTTLGARRLGRMAAAMPYRGVVIDGDDVVDGAVVSEWYDDGPPSTRRAIGD
ncbi:FxsA family protein [Nocardia sp. NPDC051463]|uniref:FxsA family protein n=1 Tax=Nocardia sp. NPDC051463 TaxID=3154845 RepID=UPI00344D1F69